VVSSVSKKGAIFGSILILALMSSGVFLTVNSLTPLDKKYVLVNDSFSVAGNKYENRTGQIDSSGEYVATFTVSEGTIKSALMIGPVFSLWAEGKYTPDWVESDQADLGTGVSLGGGESATMYVVFWNTETLTKQVHLEVSKVWKETNYIGLFGGAALVLSCAIITIALMYRRATPRNL